MVTEGNYAKFLKNLHSEQINKLILKNQHECDLLEDIRTFIIKRSAIEKSYSEALLKISSAYLNKKIPNIPDIKVDGGEEKWNMWNVWRTVLEENEKLARARLAAVEVFQQQIADDAKILRAHKLQTAKKCVDQLALVQKELQLCVQDVDKTKKLYFDEEHGAHEVRDKARDIEEKLKKKKGSFFQSITSLQKNSAKVSSKRDQLEEKSTGARNDYLLCLAAANAHQTRYFVVDLQLCMTTMESGVYDKVAEYLSLMGRTELLTCSAMQNSFSTIRDQAKQLTREYNLQCCYLYYPVLKQHIHYEFDPCDNDPVEHVTADHDSSSATLSKEARRWATKIARENNNVKESVRKLQIYHALKESGQRVDPNDQNGPDLETKIEEMKHAIRRAETAKTKAEARIECLRGGGVNVDEWMQEAESLNVQDIQRSTSSLSDHPSSDSFYDSDFADGEPTAGPVETRVEAVSKEEERRESQSDHYEAAEVDAMLEQERQRIEQLTAGWDDPTQVDWGTEDNAEEGEGLVGRQEAVPSTPLLKCTALYSYTAQNPDELTIVENEQLEVVGEGDGDGWLRARNYRGEEGYVPQNYLDIEREQSVTTPGLQTQISFSSVDYTVDNEEESAQQATETTQSPEQISVISIPQKTPDGTTPEYCIALYDYEGEGGEELTFEEGQIIKILSRCAHSIDDGWWQGELEGHIGNFPSLVVEECDEFGEPLVNEWDETPPQSAPPVFTPPDVPDYLADTEEGDEVTISSPPLQPPPPAPPIEEGDEAINENGEIPEEGEVEAEDGEEAPEDAAALGGFAMALSRDQQNQYGSQFNSRSSGAPNAVPTIDVPTVEIVDEDSQEVDQEDQQADSDFGLCAAQIVITAATPMMEEAASPFPPPEDSEVNHKDGGKDHSSIPEEDEEDSKPSPSHPSVENDNKRQETMDDLEEVFEDHHADTPFVVSSSTGSDGETTGPSTAENSVSQAPPATEPETKQVVGGRASIPDELEPHQLARLQDLKESNA
ncbi:protein nervous wreck isoform X2 [Diabrotica virgifera virgifera]|uniref:F-BAR and double SH3 domains protein 2 n=1 Tax=Diabrotica virgifera virgifera TaxID=50390 RepID=A0ABM5L8U2_DIAVI|nr:protein nervous wreck isoform X2 [Diabrotica virgifera virgifera]